MKLQRWWLPTTAILGLGGMVIAYPALQHSLQSFAWEQHQFQPKESPIINTETSSLEPAKKSPADQVYAQVSPAVVTVYGANGLGAGMILRSQGLVLTNKHIVDNFATVKIKMANMALYEGTVVDFDLRYDLALIQIKAPNLNLPTVTLSPTQNLKAGDRVYAIGSPGGQAGTLTQGTFTRLTEHGSLQTSTGLLSPGNSGGPLLNEQGIVVGVNKGLLTDKSGLATPVTAAKTLLQRYETIHGTRLGTAGK
jgi:S1-C subfamily serine protease